jgi:uncharacterized membrane protein YccC
MSITDIWPRRRRLIIDEQEPRPWKLPPDLEQQLSDAMSDFDDTVPEPLTPTAQQLADAIAHLKREIGNARQVVAASEARVAELETQLAKQLDEEIAELQKLRPTKGDTHANADADPRHVGDAGPDHDAGGSAALPEPEPSAGEASGPARQV